MSYEIQNDSCKRTNVTGDIKFYLTNVDLKRTSLNKGKNKNKIRKKKLDKWQASDFS